MSAKTSPDNLARIMAIVSLVVAIAAVVVSYFQQRSAVDEQKRQFQLLQKEDLTVRLNPHADGPYRMMPHNFGPLGRVVQIPWGLTLSNTGNQKLSITEYSITSGPSPNPTLYSGIDGGMLTPDHKAVDLPLNIEPGESRFLFVYVGVLVPPNVYEVLSAITDPKLRIVSHATTALARQGLDLYGNKVNYQEHPGGGYLLTVEKENQTAPTFWYRAVTGRGNIFLTSAAKYMQAE